jgi:splicing factor 1
VPSIDAAPLRAVRLACAQTSFPTSQATLDNRDSCLPHPIATPSRNIIMSWRNNAGSTGSNNIPLGTRRRGGDANGSPDFAPPPNEGKRGRSPEPVSKEPELNPDGTKKRRKRNRWGDASDNKAAGLMNLPTAITAPMTAEQLDAYVTHLRIEEISQKLRINDVVPADGDR